MSGLILCGKKAKNPYYISQIEKNIYSVEELQYYVFNNIYMIGKEFFTEELLYFLNDELELCNLAKKLANMLQKEGNFGEMIMVLLSNGSYYNVDELKEFERTMREINSMSLSQKLKTKADGYFKTGKYNAAIKAYSDIISQVKEDEATDEFMAAIWNNMAVIYARLFLYREAYACLKAAAELNPCTEIMDRLVVAALLSEDDRIVEDLIRRYGINENELSEYETALEYRKKHIRNTDEYMDIVSMLAVEKYKDLNDYYYQVRKLSEEWKSEYREEVG